MDEKLRKFTKTYEKYKNSDKIKDATLKSIEKELFEVIKAQLQETKNKVDKWNPEASGGDLPSTIDMSTTCLEIVKEFMTNMQVDQKVKFKILQNILPLVLDIGKESLAITCDTTTKTCKSSKLADRGILAQSLGQLSIASVGLLTAIVGHDTMTSFLEEKNFEFLKKEEIDKCKAQIQSRCLSLCKDIIEALLRLFRELVLSDNRSAKEFKLFLDAVNFFMGCLADLMSPLRDISKQTEMWQKEADVYRDTCKEFYRLSLYVQYSLRSLCDSKMRDTMKALPQEKVCSWCMRRDRERDQVSKLVTDSPVTTDKITSDDLNFSLYWMQIFAKEGWHTFSYGDILCRPQEMFISNRVCLQIREKSLAADLKLFMREVKAGEEDAFTSGMSRDDVDEVMAMFEVIGRMADSETRTVSFSLDVGFEEKLVRVCCKYCWNGKWSRTVDMTKKSAVLYTAGVKAIEKIVIFSSFPEKAEEISPKGSSVSLHDYILIQYPEKCFSANVNIKHKVYPVHRTREQQYKETYPDVFGGICLSETLNLEHSSSVKFKKEAKLTFSMNATSSAQVALYEITKSGLKKQPAEPIIDKNSVSFSVSDPKRVVCVVAETAEILDDVEILPTSHEDLIHAQVAVTKSSHATTSSPEGPSANQPSTGDAAKDKKSSVPKQGLQLSFIDRVKIFLGLSSHCCFIMSYKKQDNLDKPIELRLDCIESLNTHIEDRLNSLKMRDFVLFRPIVDPVDAIVEKRSKVRLEIDGNLELVGEAEVEVTFKYLMESPVSFRVKAKSKSPNEVDALAFMYFKRTDGKHFTWCIVDTNELLGKPSLEDSYTVRDASKIQSFAISEKNIDAVYDHLAYRTDDTEKYLSFIGIHQPRNVTRSGEQNKELSRVKFRTMRKNEGVEKTFCSLMDALNHVNRKDVRMLLMQHAVMGKVLNTPDQRKESH